MIPKTLISEIKSACEIASRNRHRFMVILCSSKLNEDFLKIAKKIYEIYKKETNKNDELLIAGRSFFLELAEKYFQGKFIHYKDSLTVLGETYSSLVLDFTEGFHPNDLGIIVETIGEGGIIIVLSPRLEKWTNLIGKWHEELISEPYTVKDITPRFYRRFIRRTLKAEGIIIYDVEKRELIKRYKYSQTRKNKKNIKIPKKRKEIRRKLYELCATQDQIKVLQVFESYFDRKKDRKTVVITADRGRGKTAILGIVTPYLISRMHKVLKRPIRVMVVAPTPYAVQTYFKFLKIALTSIGVENFKIKESNSLITVLSTKFARVEYTVPRRAMIEKDLADVIIVDEAAGIDVPVLWKIIEGARYTIFSSTIHGYEGAGRGFNIRFLKRLELEEDIEIEKVHMDEPVRYGKNDPIEKWLYDVLLLDAQPAEINDVDIKTVEEGKLKFEEVSKNKLFSDERLLREFFGIYILAHYRNRPSDIVILSDMPNHLAFRVVANGKTVCSLHVAVEGGLNDSSIEKMADGYKPRGQIIPDLILKHYWEYDFPKLKGIRIVRIATHPSLMRKGIGSFALKKMCEWAKKRKLEWIGSGFGISPELLRFWIKNDFLPLHITPQRNEVSGEYTVIVLRALTKRVEDKLKKLNRLFIKRIIEYLSDELKDLEIDAAKNLLHSLKSDIELPKPSISEVERKRLKKYFQGVSLYEYVSDVVRPIIRYYYSKKDKADLEEKEENILVMKCLQLKPWWEIKHDKFEGTKVYKLLLKAIKKVWKWYEASGKNKL